MAITKSEVIALADTLGGTTGSTVSMGFYYDEIMQGLAMRFEPPLVETTTFAISSGTASYSWPSDACSILAIFSESKQLFPVSFIELESYDGAWRQTTGEVQVFYSGEDPQRSFRLHPIPSTASTGTVIMGVAPVGGQGVTSIPDYMGLYLACEILRREFAKPSVHQDKQFSKAAGDVAQIFGMLAGLV